MTPDQALLFELFLAGLPEDLRAQVPAAGVLDELLQSIWKQVRAAWPGLALAPEKFWPFVARRLPQDRDLTEALTGIQTADLYLVASCLDGNEEAQRAFTAHCLPVVRKAMSRIDSSGSLDDDVLQKVLYRLFTEEDGGQPRLAQYGGRSSIASWVRVVAIRQALNLKRSTHRERPLDEEGMLDMVAADNQEMTYFKQLYRDEFKRAFHLVLLRLSTRDRNLLSLQMEEGLSLEQIGEIYRVNRSTVSRWLKVVRDKLHDETRLALMDALCIGSEEFESIMKLIMSRFDASLHRVLGPDG